MDLLKETKDLCNLYHIKPAHNKGQNFLINQEVYDKIIAAADLKPRDTVLEVGPGLGFLTVLLAKQVKQVVAVEVDKKLAEVLKVRLAAQNIHNVEVINDNILNFQFSISNFQMPTSSSIHDRVGTISNFQFSKYKIVANLPYNITSIFLRKFLSGQNQPRAMTLLLQREVAERLTAAAGAMSLLGLSVQFYAEPKLIARVDQKDFWPEPQVASAIVNLTVKTQAPLGETETKLFFRLARLGFSAKRKMLKNNLAAGLSIGAGIAENYLVQAGLKPTCRPQDLGLEEWLKLFKLVKF